MVYGTTLRLPGKFFTPASDDLMIIDSTDHIQSLKLTKLQPTQPRPVHNPYIYVDPALQSQSHVFIIQDSVRKPLQQPYNGPFKVISRTKKHFTIDVNGRQEFVSIDRLKAAYSN